jgi:tetratricopeptide (TPR) repeat protein
LALVDPDWNDRPSPIFTLNALVAAFVEGQKSDHRPRVTEIEDQSVVVLREVAASVGFCPHDIQRLLTLDDVELRRNIEFTVRWCVERERSHDVIALTRDIRYWYYVRGVWSPDPDPNLTRAVAARALGDASEECDALLYYCNIAAKAENAAALQRHLPRVEKILGELPSGDPRQASSRHVHALAALAKGDNARAVELWEENLAQTELDDADLSANRRWLGIALYRRGSHGEARQVLNEAVAHDTQINFRRAIVSSKLQLVRIDLSLHLSHRSDEAAHDIPTLSGQLQDLEPEVAKLSDPLYSGEWSELYGKAALLQHLNADAERFLQQAEATFQRLGLLSRANAIKHDLMSLREQHT